MNTPDNENNEYLYFLSCIYDIFDDENYIENYETYRNRDIDRKEGRVFIALEKVTEKPNASETTFETREFLVSKIKGLNEGDFVYFEDDILRNANNNIRAKGERFLNNRYRGKIIKKYKKDITKDIKIKVKELFSYHINVGHGNCSILVIKEQNKTEPLIWMVDCSIKDFTDKADKGTYLENICCCINFIKDKHNICEFRLDKFFLTHTHYDHYSGIIELLNQDYIDNDTEIWINANYGHASPYYNKINKRLLSLSQFIEPVEANSTNTIKIMHPKRTVVKSQASARNYVNPIVESKINNSSIVYKFNFKMQNNKTISILFPGDIETDGWDRMNNCEPYLDYSDYYCISHHGSITGHIRKLCPVNPSLLYNNLSFCARNANRVILMGRDKAFKGIYSIKVIEDFQKKLLKSEKDINGLPCRFLEIDLINDKYYHI